MGVRRDDVAPTCPPEHSHGTYCYQKHKCKCRACRTANSNASNKASRKRTIRARKSALLISARGTQRRLQALSFMGWDMGTLSARTGLTQNNLAEIRAGIRPGCRARTHILVAREYDKLWDKEPPPSRVRSLTRALARRKGYPGPLHWDDIDRDPDGVPEER